MSQNKRNCEGASPPQDEKEENSVEAPNEFDRKSVFRRSKSCVSLLTGSKKKEQKSKKTSILKSFYSFFLRKSKSYHNLSSNNENQEQNKEDLNRVMKKEEFGETEEKGNHSKMTVKYEYAPPDNKDEEKRLMRSGFPEHENEHENEPSTSGVQIKQPKSKAHENASLEHENEPSTSGVQIEQPKSKAHENASLEHENEPSTSGVQIEQQKSKAHENASLEHENEPSTSGVQIEQQKSKAHENASFEHEIQSFYIFSKNPIGLGCAGTCVYSGVNTKDGREVAIKKINCHTEKQSSQYKKEIEHLLHLKHCENVVNYLDVEVEKDVVYIILELMEGTLETLVNRPDIKITINFTELCHDIISALDFLHNQTTKTIIHRDIKPRNILFVSNPRLMLKLADFGLSKVLDSDSSSIGYNGGTRCWMAPEALKNLKHFSTASDVFAAGLVLHFLMTSRNPFAPNDVTMNRENRLWVEHRTIDNVVHQKMNLDKCLSPETLHLIGQMVNHDKDQRPTADEALGHPFFWSDKKKLKFLEATANQPEIFQKGVNDVKKDLQSTQLAAQFQRVLWSEQSPTMGYVYNEMKKSGRRSYDTRSVADLVRFMRNAYQHVSEQGRTPLFQKFVLQDSVFLNEFKSLFLTVYETVRKHEWDKNKPEVQSAVSY